MNDERTDLAALARGLKDRASELGFELCGIAPAVAADGFSNLRQWLQSGYAGEMGYIERRTAAYEHPEYVLPRVRSVMMLGMNYRTLEPPTRKPGRARVARYAWGSVDYHDLIRSRLKQLAGWLHARVPDCRTRGVVDTAPLLERDFARRAGLGWFGKNTMLIDKRRGSYFFLAALLTDLELPADTPHDSAHCGTCTRCLEACPTEAFPAPHVLDARRCISYLTIELRNQPIPDELRGGIGDWLFGCDICQEVCPWNSKPAATAEPGFLPLNELHPADAAALLRMDDATFQTRFEGTPLIRPGRAGLLRNAAIVLGNSGDNRHLPPLHQSLHDPEPMIRGAAAWAIGRLGRHRDAADLSACVNLEQDAYVRGELTRAIERLTAKA